MFYINFSTQCEDFLLKHYLPLLGLLSACQYVTSEAAALRDFDPLSVPPETLRAGIVTPPGLRLPMGGAVLIVDVSRSDIDAEIRETFILMTTDSDAVSNLAIQPADYDRYRATQDQARAWQTAAPNGTSGSITVDVSLCETAPGSSENARISVVMAPGPNEPMVSMIENLPVSAVGPNVVRPGDDPACDS